jgi:hypothetical protein
MRFPRMVTARQQLFRRPLADPRSTLTDGLEEVDFGALPPPGSRIAVAVGSRSIDGLVMVVSRLVESLKARGCEPFIVPAMGSHGGATADGQGRLLRGMGIHQGSIGAPVEASMDTVSLGASTGGSEVFISRAALQSDGIILLNKVAPHTGYSGPVQSGLAKMIVVGLGKSDGAFSLHHHGFSAGYLIGDMAALAIEKVPVLMAVALLEDGTGRLSHVEVIERDGIMRREPALLEMALSMWPRIPVASADVLIVDEMGKDFSGIGMDPLVTGRGKELPPGEYPAFTARRLVALRLSPGSRGNATGVGHADIITESLFGRIDFHVTYRNVITSGAPYRARIPVVALTDKEAVSLAIESLGGVPPGDLRVVRIKNTRRLEEMQVSTALTGEMDGLEGVELGSDEREMSFDSTGNLGN